MRTYVAGWMLSLLLVGFSFGQGTRGGGFGGGTTGGLTTGGTGGGLTGSRTSGSGFGTASGLGSGLGGTTSGFGQTTGGQGQTGGFGQTSAFGGQFGATGASANPFGTAASGVFSPATSSLLGTAAMGSTVRGLSGLSSSGMGGMGISGMGGMSGMGGAMGGRSNAANMNRNNQSQNQTKIRSSVRLGFELPARRAEERSQALQARIPLLRLGSSSQNVQVSMQGRTAVLRGRIATQADSSLAERLLQLEPGVDEVRNELVVSSQ